MTFQWSGWRDTVLVDVCNPIWWHAPPLMRVVIPGTPSGNMYSLVTSHSCIIAVCFLLNHLFHVTARAPDDSAICPAFAHLTSMPADWNGWGKAMRPGEAGHREIPVQVTGRGRGLGNMIKEEEKTYLTQSTDGTVRTGDTRLCEQESGVGSAGEATGAVERVSLRSRVQREGSRRGRSRERAGRGTETVEVRWVVGRVGMERPMSRSGSFMEDVAAKIQQHIRSKTPCSTG
jgi:hypothetical protein